MYSFEGDFRRKPVQSLRGASKKEEREELLRRAQQERQKREKSLDLLELVHLLEILDHRLRNESAAKIQSCFRSHSVREKQVCAVRQEFDRVVQNYQMSGTNVDMATLCSLQQKLSFFYRSKHDSQRLVWVCQAMMKKKDDYMKHVSADWERGLYLIQRLLLKCLRYLHDIANSSAPIAMPMRMLEIFTSSETYQSVSYTPQTHPLLHIWAFLIKHGYFDFMRVLLEAKVPSDIERSSNPPTPLGESILSLIMAPVSFASQFQSQHYFSTYVLEAVCQSLLCPAYSQQIEFFLIPAMAYGKFPFSFVDLIQTLILHTTDKSAIMETSEMVQRSRSHLVKSIDWSPWLLGSVITMADKHLGNLNSDQIVKFLLVLKALLPTLAIKKVNTKYEDSDSEEDMEIDYQVSSSSELQRVQQQCMVFLNSTRFVKCVISCLGNKLSHQVVSSVCVICHSLMSHHHLSIHKLRLLYSLAFNTRFIRTLWFACISVSNKNVTGSTTPLLQTLSRGSDMTNDDINRIVPMLAVFCTMFSHSLYTLHDADFYGETDGTKCSMPFSLEELVPMTQMLRNSCLGIIELAHPDARLSVTEDYLEALVQVGMRDRPNRKEEEDANTQTWAHLFKVTASLVRQLYIRDSRRRYCPNNHWLSDRVAIQADKPSQIYRAQGSVFTRRPFGTMKSLTKVQLEDDGPPLSNTDVKNLVILTELPFVVSFEERVKILQKLIMNDRTENQGEMANFLSGPAINVMIRRNFLYEDAFDKLSPENEPDMRLKMRVQLVNAAGLDEAGIDGGGIFREFLSELLKTGFDPNRGMFCYTNDKLLYPNPQSIILMENYTKHYFFLGRMLAKAIYENMLVELPFASFFLSKILSRHGGDLDIHHLASLDPQMYKNLLFLKTYEGDVMDLDLDFTAVNNDFGQTKTEELKPGGGNIPVTESNKIEYIHLMADYKINKQIRTQCAAFRQGMADVINLEWLRMFDHHELQVIISGAVIPVDIIDLQHHTNYSGGYTTDHPVIRLFWKVVENFTNNQKRQLLKFVTSCSRPPLLGFKDLYPAFCVHYGGSEADRLPTASTCMNLLKLPEFNDEFTMKTKLLYAIESGAGFELS